MDARRPRTVIALCVAGIGVAVLFVAYVCAFRMIDVDVWWHIAAGRLMRSSHALIALEPFAYTREGLPYLARHEWLAQVAISLVFDAFGAAGVILLRTLLVTAALLPILLIHKRQAWTTFPLAVFGCLALRPAILDRPQLFTFAIFSVELWMALAWLDRRLASRSLIVAFLALQVLWINLHGGAALLSIAVAGALLCQSAFDAWREGATLRSLAGNARVRIPLALLALLPVASLLSPSTYHNLEYVRLLATDDTVQFINEWMPRGASAYRYWILPCWIAAILAVGLVRRRWIFGALLLGAFGLLSLRALRHEPFFVLTALLLTAYELGESSYWLRFRERLERALWPGIAIMAIASVALAVTAYRAKFVYALRYGWGGYGTYEPAKGAADFLEREAVPGRMFNTYDAGSYLLFRGFPARPVFVDGRNVDFGYDFLREYFAAGADAAVLRSLEARFGFTVAVVEFWEFEPAGRLPYSPLLRGFPDWAQVYIDDASAVFVRRDAAHAGLVEREEYRVLTSEMLLDPATNIPDVAEKDLQQLERELIRAEKSNPEALRPLLARAVLYRMAGAYPEAEALLAEVRRRAPYRYESYSILASIRAAQGRPLDAGLLYEEAIRRAGGEGRLAMDYEHLSALFAEGGDQEKAERYRKKAVIR